MKPLCLTCDKRQVQNIFIVLNNPRKKIIFQNIHPEHKVLSRTAYQFSVQQETKNHQTMEIQFSSHPCLRHLREKDYQIQQSCYTNATALRPYNCLTLLTMVAWHECLRIKRKHLRLIEISYAGMWRQAGETVELNLKHCTLLSPDTHFEHELKGENLCWGQSWMNK